MTASTRLKCLPALGVPVGAPCDLVQEQFSWIERREGQELRRFEVDFPTGQALAVTLDGKARVRLDLPAGRSYTGYGVALVAGEASLQEGAHTEVTFVAFTPKPRAVTLEIRRGGQERIQVAGRAAPCDAYTLHPKIPFPLNLFAGAKDAHLWLTHAAPSGLVRAQQNLVAKDAPVVIIDVTPRGPPVPLVAKP